MQQFFQFMILLRSSPRLLAVLVMICCPLLPAHGSPTDPEVFADEYQTPAEELAKLDPANSSSVVHHTLDSRQQTAKPLLLSLKLESSLITQTECGDEAEEDKNQHHRDFAKLASRHCQVALKHCGKRRIFSPHVSLKNEGFSRYVLASSQPARFHRSRLLQNWQPGIDRSLPLLI